MVVRFAVKPTSSILTPRRTITKAGEPTEIVTGGRHDPCVGIRAVPVAEAMAATVILDHILLDRAQTGGVRGPIGFRFINQLTPSAMARRPTVAAVNF